MNQVNPTPGASSRGEERFPDATIITEDGTDQVWDGPVILDERTGLPKEIRLATESFPTTVAVKDSGQEAPQTPEATVTRLAGSTRRRLAFGAFLLGAVVTVGGALKVKQSQDEIARLQTQIDELKKDRTSERVEAELERMRAQVDRALWVSWLAKARMKGAEAEFSEKARAAGSLLKDMEQTRDLARERAEEIKGARNYLSDQLVEIGKKHEDAFLDALKRHDGIMKNLFDQHMKIYQSETRNSFLELTEKFDGKFEKHFGFRNFALAQIVPEVAGRGHPATAEERTQDEELVRSLGMRPKFTVSMKAVKNPDGTFDISIDSFTSDPLTDEEVVELAIAVGAVPTTYNFAQASIGMRFGNRTQYNSMLLPGVRGVQAHFLEHDGRYSYPSFRAYQFPKEPRRAYVTDVASKPYSYSFRLPKEPENQTK